MTKLRRFWHRFAIQLRLVVALFVAVSVAAGLPSTMFWLTRLLMAWDAAMVTWLGLIGVVMVTATPDSMRQAARREDPSRVIILSVITIAALASLLAIVWILRSNRHLPPEKLVLHVLLAFGTILVAWFLVHTIFALHYAHGYYNDDVQSLQQAQDEELDFPGDIDPDYWDFMYFSFVIGMTSQVSDVQIFSRSLRRLALLHGILSFFFNTTILAMSINLFAGLIQGAN